MYKDVVIQICTATNAQRDREADTDVNNATTQSTRYNSRQKQSKPRHWSFNV